MELLLYNYYYNIHFILIRTCLTKGYIITNEVYKFFY